MARDMTLMLRVAADVKAARTSLDELTNKARGLGVASQKAASGTDHLGTSLQRIGHYGAAAFGTVQIKQFVFSLREAQLEATRIGNTLKFALGGESQGVAGMRYVADLANKLGLELRATAQGYAKFAAAASSANLSISQTNAIFEGVAKATTVLGLSGADAGGVFLALSQMLSKGKVSAEELRGQLGERLPGALAIAARAQGVTTEKFSEMLDKGQIIARDFLPRFAAEMEKTFGAASGSAAQSAIANVNRLANAWDLFKQKFGTASDTAGITAPNWLTRALNEANAAMDKSMAKGNALLTIFGALGGFGAGALGKGVLSEQSRQERIIALQEQRFELEKRIQEIAKGSGSQDVKRGGTAVLRSDIAAINRELETLWKKGKIKLPSKDELESARQATLDSAKRKAPAADAENKKATDPLASLLAQTDIARLAEYERLMALLIKRQKAGKLSAEQYAEAVSILLQRTFGDQVRDNGRAMAEDAEFMQEVERSGLEVAREHLEYRRALAAADAERLTKAEAIVEAIRRETVELGMTRQERELAADLLALEESGIDRQSDAYRALREAIVEANAEREKAREIEAQNAEAAKISEEAWKNFASGLQSSIANALLNMEGSFRGFVRSIVDMFKNTLAQSIAKSISEAILKGMNSGGGGGGGGGLFSGLLKGLFGGIGKLFGFAEGGYTGPGGKYQPAGTVHAGEYVFSAASVRRLGLDFLHNLHAAAKGGFVPAMPRLAYAEGGPVSLPAAQAAQQSIRIVNAIDPGVTHDHLNTPAGERLIVNIIGHNARAIRAALGT